METEMTASPSTDIRDMELTVWLRPVGLFLLIGQVHTLSPMLEPRDDVRLWMRWAESEETGVEGARIEFAESTRRDHENRTARVVARATMVDRTQAWHILRFLEIQGFIDLWVHAPPAPDGSLHKVVPWFACAEHSRQSAKCATNPYPMHYV